MALADEERRRLTSARLTFNAPLGKARAEELVVWLARGRPATVLDLGCGTGELLLRTVAVTGAAGTGVDLDAAALATARDRAAGRDLGRLVTFVEGDASAWSGTAEAVIAIGAAHAWGGGAAEALAGLRAHVADGGRLLYGDGVWEREPTAELRSIFGSLPDLAGLVQQAAAAGFRVLRHTTSTVEEWEEFEAAYLADEEVWLAANPGHAEAAETAERVESHRRAFLEGYRGVMGQADVTLVG
jgi:cyclopropane fatty-acyl-phospholipid synthase-like methyltransferase